jgi:streptomycin 6-kinase
MFDHYLKIWCLTPVGAPIVTHTSQLLPVLHKNQPAMLKVTEDPDEKHGHLLMRWWAGDGAAHVLAHGDGAVLLERATGPGSLVTLANEGQDQEATRIICDVARHLHAPRGDLPSGLMPLTTWFEPLAPTAQAQGGTLVQAAAAAARLLASQREIVPLHADLHHENILDFGEWGWLAIDPKRVDRRTGFRVHHPLLRPRPGPAPSDHRPTPKDFCPADRVRQRSRLLGGTPPAPLDSGLGWAVGGLADQ